MGAPGRRQAGANQKRPARPFSQSEDGDLPGHILMLRNQIISEQVDGGEGVTGDIS